jgi:hypothetical protein
LELAEYIGSFMNPEAARKAREFRNAPVVESDEDVLEAMKDRDKMFGDDLIKGIGDRLKNNTNKNREDSNFSSDVQSPVYKIIKDS